MMHSGHSDGMSCLPPPFLSTSVYVGSQYGKPSDQSHNKLQKMFPSSYSPKMSTAMIQNYGSTSNSNEQFYPQDDLQTKFVAENCLDEVFVVKSETSKCGGNDVSESSYFPNSFERAVNSNRENNQSCNDEFESETSNKSVLNKSLDMKVKDCNSRSKNNVALLGHSTVESEVLFNKSDEAPFDRKENPVNGTDVIQDTAVNNSSCISDEGSDDRNEDSYDHNSWILYGDSKISAKNSWVLYGDSHSSPNEKLKPETDLAQNDESLAVETDGDKFEENVKNGGSDHVMKDKESSYEDLFNESRPHACKVCCKRFKLSHHLKEHMRIHTGEKPFPCPMCGERFSRSHLLRAHQARHAQESFPSVGTIFPCSKCMKIFESPQHLARHEKNHIQVKIHKCNICDKQFAHPVLLKKHKLQHDPTKNVPLNSSMDMSIKQEPQDRDSLNCDSQQDGPNEDKTDLRDFKKRCTSSSSECHLPTKENKPLVNNMFSDHKMGSTEKKSSEEKNLYDQSSWVLYGDAINKETACETMKERQQMDSSESDGNTSSSVYKGIDLAKLHELYMATNRSLFNRNGMMSPFYSMFEFNRHALMSLIDHTAMNSSAHPLSYIGEKNVKTEPSFADRSRPHQCPHCSKRFKLSHHLREHMRIHTGEKPYHCDVCQERFSRSHLLQRHKTKHIADLTFHQVTDWIQKTSGSSSDANQNSYTYNEITDRFLSQQEQSDKLGNQSNTDVCMEDPTSLVGSPVQKYTSHSSNHRLGNDDHLNCTKSSEQALKALSNCDYDHNVCTDSHIPPYQCTNKRSDTAVHAVPDIDNKSSTVVKISGLDSTSTTEGISVMIHKSHSNLGISGTFQNRSCIDGVAESDHKSSCVNETECVDTKVASNDVDRLDCKSNSFSVSKMNLKHNSIGFLGMDYKSEELSENDGSSDCIDGVSGVGHQSDSVRSGPVFPNSYRNSQEDHSDGDLCTERVASDGHTQSEQSTDQRNVDKNIHESNNDTQTNTSTDESSVKTQSRSPMVQTKPDSAEPSGSSSFQLNPALVNNNINLFNTSYLNYTHNLQAASSAAFRSYQEGDSLAVDIPAPDLLRETFPPSLEYSNLFRSRRGGFMRCEFCAKWFGDLNNLRQHMVSHSMDRHFSCDLCEKKFKRPHHLKEHMRIHTGEKPYICDICDEKFSRSHILQRHRLKHGPSLPSDFYLQNDFYKISEQTRARSPEFVYDKLSSVSLMKGEPETQLSPSQVSDSNSDKKTEVVASDNQSDSDSGNVKKYNSLETKDYWQDFKGVLQPFVCRECGKTFANSSNLKQHMVSHFPDRLYSCTVCNKKFKRPHHLKEHSRTHTGEKPYQCSRCGERFQRSHLLMKHKEKHHSQYGYSMDVSEDSSAVKLNGYIGDEKPHETTTLPNADDSTNTLEYNESQKAGDSDRGDTSSGEAVSCDVCNKEFSSELMLTVHKRTHPGDRPHQCENCGKHFALQYLLEVHEKSCI